MVGVKNEHKRYEPTSLLRFTEFSAEPDNLVKGRIVSERTLDFRKPARLPRRRRSVRTFGKIAVDKLREDLT